MEKRHVSEWKCIVLKHAHLLGWMWWADLVWEYLSLLLSQRLNNATAAVFVLYSIYTFLFDCRVFLFVFFFPNELNNCADTGVFVYGERYSCLVKPLRSSLQWILLINCEFLEYWASWHHLPAWFWSCTFFLCVLSPCFFSCLSPN